MLFLIQIGSARRFALARDIDPAYGKAFDAARAAGVEAIAYRCGDHSRRYRGGGAGCDQRIVGALLVGDHNVVTSGRPQGSPLPASPLPACFSRLVAYIALQNSGLMPRGGGAAAALDELRRRGIGAATQDRTDQAARPGRLRRHAQGRAAGRRVPRHARRRGQARRADRADRPAGVRIRHGPRGDAGHPDVSRLPQGDLHLGQSRGLPRHPGREAAQGGRHRQCRRDADPRRLARRFEPHVSRSARSRAAPSG